MIELNGGQLYTYDTRAHAGVRVCLRACVHVLVCVRTCVLCTRASELDGQEMDKQGEIVAAQL